MHWGTYKFPYGTSLGPSGAAMLVAFTINPAFVALAMLINGMYVLGITSELACSIELQRSAFSAMFSEE